MFTAKLERAKRKLCAIWIALFFLLRWAQNEAKKSLCTASYGIIIAVMTAMQIAHSFYVLYENGEIPPFPPVLSGLKPK